MADNERILKILLRIQSDLSGLGPLKSGVQEVKTGLEQTAKAGFSLGDAFKFAGAEEALRRMLDVVKEIPAHFVEWTQAGVEFNAQVQQLQVGLAAVLQLTQSAKFGNFEQAEAGAAEFISVMKDKANELGIVYTDMFESVQHTQAQLANAGVNDVNKAIELTVVLNRAMQSVGVSSVQAARDIGDILQGQAARTLGGGRIAPLLGMTKEELDLWILGLIQTGQLYDGLMQKMGPLANAVRAGSETFQAQVNRMHNALLDLKGDLAEPLMAPLTNAIERFTEIAKSENVQGLAAAIGDLGAYAIKSAEAVGGLVAKLGEFAQKHQEIAAFQREHPIISLIASPGAAAALTAGNLQQAEAEKIAYENSAKRLDTLLKQVEVTKLANSEQEEQKQIQDSVAVVDELIAEAQKRLLSDATQFKDVWSLALTILRQFRGELALGLHFGAGLQPDGTPQAKLTEKQFDFLKDIVDQTKILNAQAAGNTQEAAILRVNKAYDDAIKKLRLMHGDTKQNIAVLNEWRDAAIGAAEAHASQKGAAKDVTAFLREESAELAHIHNLQQIINANPFLGVDEKTKLNAATIVTEISQLNELIKQGDKKLEGGALDPTKYEEVAKAVDNLRTRVQLLKFQLQESSFTGGLIADLTKWTNSFGTAAQQIGKTIQGTINASLQQFNQLLLTGKFNTQQLLQQVVQLGLTLIEQLILQRAMMAINRAFAVGQAATTGPTVAAAWAPAATMVSIATEGQADVQAPALVAAALASIQGLAFAERGGLITGPTITMMGEAGPEFVFSAPAVRNIGVENLEAAHQAARSTSSGAVTSTSSPGSRRGGGGDVHFVGLFFDKNEARKALYDREGRQHLIDIVRREKIQLGSS